MKQIKLIPIKPLPTKPNPWFTIPIIPKQLDEWDKAFNECVGRFPRYKHQKTDPYFWAEKLMIVINHKPTQEEIDTIAQSQWIKDKIEESGFNRQFKKDWAI